MKEWEAAREWVMAAVVDPEDTETAIVERLLNGSAQLWLGEAGAMVTEIIEDDEGPRHIHVWLAGGSLPEVISFIPGIAAFARMMGCTEATVEGRKGWARALRPHGFSGSRLLRKAL